MIDAWVPSNRLTRVAVSVAEQARDKFWIGWHGTCPPRMERGESAEWYTAFPTLHLVSTA